MHIFEFLDKASSGSSNTIPHTGNIRCWSIYQINLYQMIKAKWFAIERSVFHSELLSYQHIHILVREATHLQAWKHFPRWIALTRQKVSLTIISIYKSNQHIHHLNFWQWSSRFKPTLVNVTIQCKNWIAASVVSAIAKLGYAFALTSAHLVLTIEYMNLNTCEIRKLKLP